MYCTYNCSLSAFKYCLASEIIQFEIIIQLNKFLGFVRYWESWLPCACLNASRQPKQITYEGAPNSTLHARGQPPPQPCAGPQMRQLPSHLELPTPVGPPPLHVPLSQPRQLEPLNHQLRWHLHATHCSSNTTTNTYISTSTIRSLTSTTTGQMKSNPLQKRTKTHQNIKLVPIHPVRKNSNMQKIQPVGKAPLAPILPPDNQEQLKSKMSQQPQYQRQVYQNHLQDLQQAELPLKQEQNTKNLPTMWSQQPTEKTLNILKRRPSAKLGPIHQFENLKSPTVKRNQLKMTENYLTLNPPMSQTSRSKSHNSLPNRKTLSNKCMTTNIQKTNPNAQNTQAVINTNRLVLVANTKLKTTADIQTLTSETFPVQTNTHPTDNPVVITTKLHAVNPVRSTTTNLPTPIIQSPLTLIKQNKIMLNTPELQTQTVSSHLVTKNMQAPILKDTRSVETNSNIVMNTNHQSLNTNSHHMNRNQPLMTQEHQTTITNLVMKSNIQPLTTSHPQLKPSTSTMTTSPLDPNTNPPTPSPKDTLRATSFNSTTFTQTRNINMAMAHQLNTSNSHTDNSSNSNRLHINRANNSINHLSHSSSNISSNNINSNHHTQTRTNITNPSLILFPPSGTQLNHTQCPGILLHQNPDPTIRSTSRSSSQIWSTHTQPRAATAAEGMATPGLTLRLMSNRFLPRAPQLPTPHTPGLGQPSQSQLPIRMPRCPTPLPDLIPVEFERRTLHTHMTMDSQPLTYQRTLSHPTLPIHCQRTMREEMAGSLPRSMPTIHNTRATLTSPGTPREGPSTIPRRQLATTPP